MTGNTRKSGSKKTLYSSYRCSNNSNHKGCTNREIHKDNVEHFVLEELYNKLFSEVSIRNLGVMIISGV